MTRQVPTNPVQYLIGEGESTRVRQQKDPCDLTALGTDSPVSDSC
ncbi:MAG: hypothetical protein H6R22_1002, partial [Chromatiaceae bacterium]|nr:hypothetical protein [Chromatiaceae bacterium]